MATQISTLRPGLLVSLKTSIRGNVTYSKHDLEEERIAEAERKKWETERTIADAAEFDAAKKARNLASTAIRGVCTWSAFGLLCPEDRKDELDAALVEARRIVDTFNAGAGLTSVSVNVIAGRIAADDVEAVRAINSEVRDLLDEMKAGVEALDVQTIRDAANRARGLGAMLTPEAQVRIQFAIDAARGAAREIVKAGETAAMEVDRRAVATITESRTAFLDLDGGVAVGATAEKARAVDFEPAILVNPVMARPVYIEME